MQRLEVSGAVRHIGG